MAKIKLSADPYQCEINTEVMDVDIREAFNGVNFSTKGGERLTVVMRDGGFEVHYSGNFGQTGFDAGMTEFKNGFIRRQGEN